MGSASTMIEIWFYTSIGENIPVFLLVKPLTHRQVPKTEIWFEEIATI
jgi:hypothetical protein